MQRFVIALALVMAASPAAAQPAPWSPERITAGWVFTPSIVFGGMWDSNVTVRNDPTDLDPEIAAWAGIVNPRGEIGFNGRRARFTAGYSGTLEAYRELAELTRYDQRGRLDAQYQMTPRLQFNARQQLTITPTTEQLDLGGLPFTRVGSRMLDVNGGFVYDLTQRAEVRANYNFQWVNFNRTSDAPEFRFLQGGHSHSPSAELKYAVAKRLNIGGAWNFRQTSLDGGEEMFRTQEGVAVVEFELGASTTLRGRAGAAHVDMIRSGRARSGPAFGGSFSHSRARVEIETSYDRSFLPSFGFGGLTAIERFHAGVLVPFAHGRMFTAASFAWRRNEPAPEQGLNITLNSYWVQSTFAYSVARWLRMETFVNVTHQTSVSATQQGFVDRTRVGIQFVSFKPVRIQ